MSNKQPSNNFLPCISNPKHLKKITSKQAAVQREKIQERLSSKTLRILDKHL